MIWNLLSLVLQLGWMLAAMTMMIVAAGLGLAFRVLGGIIRLMLMHARTRRLPDPRPDASLPAIRDAAPTGIVASRPSARPHHRHQRRSWSDTP